MTIVRIADIREQDVKPEAGMSNIPWEYDYGFQIIAAPFDEQEDILEQKYFYESESREESILDGLSPDPDGTFNTNITVRRKSGEYIVANYSRERLIIIANNLLRKSAVKVNIKIQREFIQEQSVEYRYEFCKDSKPIKCCIIEGNAFPLKQMLDLQGRPSIGKIKWVEDFNACPV